MQNPILRLLGWTLTALTPRPSGRHRAPHLTWHLPDPRAPQLPHHASPLDGAASPLVRPYLLGDAESHLEARRQRERRRALYLATLGIDIGPNRIHGIPVGATR
ncbi:hypothetical protein OG266_18390 [Streptomyces sp. NBC_00554]|uniref:hypothetical protein n=1 Tax=Streptomyces sp. NBC_00554 TaxID=2903661 RepID=UPI00352BEDA6|nr:hypothetical protein OG266_18390 [Streptomyces sp. NBC_00554]